MQSTETINYQPLGKLKAPAAPEGYIALAAAAALFLCIILSVMIPDLSALSVLALPLSIGIIIGGTVYVYNKNKSVGSNNARALAQFASANNFKYVSRKDLKGFRSGTLFEHGHSKRFRNIMSGTYQELPFELSNYEYMVGNGNDQQLYLARVMEFTLPRSMPHMVIDSLIEQDDYHRSTLPIEFDSSQRIALEGDFSRYFHLYAPDTYGVTALTILAPDAMMTLLKSAALCDMEIKDNKLYFYWPGKADTIEEYKTVFDTSAAVLSEISEKLTRSDIFATPNQAVIHSQPGQGVGLKKSFYAKYGTHFIVAGIVLIWFVPSLIFGDSRNFQLVWSFWIFVPFIIYGLKARKSKALRRSLAERYQR
ncbi:hypothetical protein H7Y63_03480 [Polaromonas sp.]|nr:hypothetical protein [Candidatus Saccharibacteria bacterium]